MGGPSVVLRWAEARLVLQWSCDIGSDCFAIATQEKERLCATAKLFQMPFFILWVCITPNSFFWLSAKGRGIETMGYLQTSCSLEISMQVANGPGLLWAQSPLLTPGDDVEDSLG